ncbi:PEPxxWA-CTERM sorting domain-containing protein [Nitrosospira sp. NRS527]|uniref:PEPxxWA-CTERM sorting domain-containing protein n=1 Tax=Nitrosospira sp. NRS527 TaxID=155925 RepID=UPI001AF9E505|nr:PEPxxWA-CTERM sorting domain-containing protein [Nitrosospira sp. NRS527]BCT66954.1 hypothetical protein NNRS527_00529 [Nitrosospira sp. NRS527]
MKLTSLLFFILSMLYAGISGAVNVPLQNATATYSQTNPQFPELWVPGKTIDGMPFGSFTSWAIFEQPAIKAQTIVWETQSNVGSSSGLDFKFDLYHGDNIPSLTHYLGHFRLSYTTDDRASFANGLANGGDVSANWTVITPTSVSSSGGDVFSILGDDSMLVTKLNSNSSTHPTYTVLATINAADITGFRLEAMKDPSLPFGGPGLDPTAGNFHLSEFVVTAVPEPKTYAMLIAGFGLMGFMARRRKGSLRMTSR